MALIQCPECGKDVSTAASTCPSCGFPLTDYVKEMEIKRLTEKILPRTEFICHEGCRTKICIKCCRPFGAAYGPRCNCGMPGVEVDFPVQDAKGGRRALYILQNDILPRNIGDSDSKEYKEYIASIMEYSGEEPIPPDPKYISMPSNVDKPDVKINIPIINHPACPYCKSTNLSKISALKKAAKISVFGIFGAGDVGKTYKCNNCGARF